MEGTPDNGHGQIAHFPVSMSPGSRYGLKELPAASTYPYVLQTSGGNYTAVSKLVKLAL